MTKTKQNRQNIVIMTVVIVLMAIGIVVRWPYIRSEVGAVIRNMFPPKTEQAQ